MRTIALALVTGAILSVGAVALAGGGPPPVDRGYPPPGVTAIGFASSPVNATNSSSENEIRRAVERANERARPRAFNDARGKAEAMAAIAGMRVGAVWSVSQDPNVPYPGSGVTQGTFGGNDFCGMMRGRHGCRAPREVTVYLTVTFEQA
jgi:hypothetical protein